MIALLLEQLSMNKQTEHEDRHIEKGKQALQNIMFALTIGIKTS